MTESETDDGAEDNSLTLDEVRAALQALTSAEHKKLDIIARTFSGGTGLDSGEIVTDAIEAALTTRSCPRHITVMAFLVQTMRSRISNHRKKCRRSIVKTPASSGDFVEARSPASLELFPSAETILVERDESEKKMPDSVIIKQIYDALGEDYEAQLLLEGWAEGMKGEALRDLIGVDQRKLDYLAKKIRRLATRLFPRGWRP